jgi:hypothetical protein
VITFLHADPLIKDSGSSKFTDFEEIGHTDWHLSAILRELHFLIVHANAERRPNSKFGQ